MSVATAERGEGILTRTVVQFFVGGLAVFTAAFFLLASIPRSEYDGIATLTGWAVVAVVIAVPSMIGAMIIGMPLRLAPAWRSLWLAHGEITVVGVILGMGACVAGAVTGQAGFGALIAGWVLLTFSIAHFVWPSRWRRRPAGPLEQSHLQT
ncbi:MAG: hypothetical protein P0Y60_10500 [Candidatus Microbacterium colombiense]|nr:MAG: hypothetical protein P0Y60_10500 [Microbacterium sp.]